MDIYTNTKKISFFSQLHPFSLLLFFFTILIFLFTLDYDFFLIPAFIIFILLDAFFEGIIKCIKASHYYLFLIIMTGLFNVAFNHRGSHIFLYINDIPLTFDSLYYGLYTGVFVSILMLWFKLFNLFFGAEKILYVFGRHFHTIALLLCIAFSYLELFRYKLSIVEHTLFTQGLKKKNLRYGATAFLLLLSIMLEDSSVTANSMIARGYMSGLKKTYKKYYFRFTDYTILIITAVLFITAFKYRFIFLLILSVPVITDLLMEVKWKCCQSKI